MSTRVVHFSPTPLVGAPAKLAAAQRQIGLDSTSIILSDYPEKGPIAKKFIDGALVWNGAEKHVIELISHLTSVADVIHIHNDFPADKVMWLRKHCRNSRFVYQVHSPVREGPLYAPRAEFIDLPFHAHLVVAQYQPRHYPGYIPVPNIILDSPSLQLRQYNQKLKVIFSPSHNRSGRWNAKYSERLEMAIRSLESLGKIEVVWPEKPLSPADLMALRRTCHVSIDEIVTGAYHQISLEGLCAGNVVLNRADFFSKAMLANCNDQLEHPPFVYADEHNVEDVLLDLVLDIDKTATIQQASHDYFCRHLAPRKLARIFSNVYEAII